MIKRELYSRNRSKVYAAFIDYTKAFDTAGRDKVWETLHNFKRSSKAVKMIRTIYSCIQCCVWQETELSEFSDCHLVFEQGCLLNPLIFSLLISEVANFVRKNGKDGIQLILGQNENILSLFADDIVSISPTPTGLQNQLNSLKKASTSWALIVNFEKKNHVI